MSTTSGSPYSWVIRAKIGKNTFLWYDFVTIMDKYGIWGGLLLFTYKIWYTPTAVWFADIFGRKLGRVLFQLYNRTQVQFMVDIKIILSNTWKSEGSFSRLDTAKSRYKVFKIRTVSSLLIMESISVFHFDFLWKKGYSLLYLVLFRFYLAHSD